MCVAVPGKITEIIGSIANVDFHGNTVRVQLGLVQATVGDYVLVHAGCAIEVMKSGQAEELLTLFDELDAIMAPEKNDAN